MAAVEGRSPASSRALLVVIYAAFVSLGLPDGALGVAWPTMRVALAEPLEALGVLTLLGTSCSALSSFASGKVLARLGTPWVVLISSLLTGGALFGFSVAPSFGWVVLLIIPFGFGAGSVDAGLNHYAAAHFSSRHMNWLHASWGIGATLGPLAISTALTTARGYRAGYLAISLAQLTLAVTFALTLRLWATAPQVAASADTTPRAAEPKPKPSAFALWLAPCNFVLYSGAEVSIGLWAASVLRDGRGLPPALAGGIAASYFGAITLGRVLSGFIAQRVDNRRLIRIGLGVACAGLLLFAVARSGVFACAGLALIGLGFAPLYPCLMHETPRLFDAETARKAIGYQVAGAYLGGMFLPALVGVVAARSSLEWVAPFVGTLLLALGLSLWSLERYSGARYSGAS